MADKPISQFPAANSVNASDVLAGVQEGVTKKFSFAVILSWLGNTLANLFVPTSRTVNNKALSADITLDATDVGAYELPFGGIPKTDLAQGVQDSLDDADSAYQMPSGGIPATDMAQGVQDSLGLADTAYQLPSGGIPSSDMASAVQTSLGKADTAYQKPSAGIPSTDMTSAVQTSLGLADTAYQKPSGGIPATDLANGVIPSVPSAYTSNPEMDGTASPGNSGNWARGNHVHPTDTSRVPVYGMGENLLDNAYFVGGGSQLGDWRLPINQRRSSSYYDVANGDFTIDRWKVSKLSGATVTVDVESAGIKLTKTGTVAGNWNHIIESMRLPVGGKCTLSVLITSITYSGTEPTLVFIKRVGFTDTVVASKALSSTGLHSVTFTVPSGADSFVIIIGAVTPASSQTSVFTVGIAAMKLELGSQQTLAHQEGSTWVLNEIPDYEAELIKCQTSTVDSTDIYANKVISVNIPNKNLLDNWWFGNPVNQREKSSYTTVGYTLDRWYNLNCPSVVVSNGYVTINGSSNGRVTWRQSIPNPSSLYGKRVTGSILLNNGELYSGAVTIPSTVQSTTTYLIFADFDGSTIRINFNTDGTIYFAVVCGTSKTLNIVAVKLELGSQQTLAHLEGSTWVLNEIPDYGEELLKCQRYCFNVLDSTDLYSPAGFGVASSTTQANIFIPTPVTMVSKPSIEYSGTIRLVAWGLSDSHDITSFSAAITRHSNNGIMISPVTTLLTSGRTYFLTANNSAAKLILSADI